LGNSPSATVAPPPPGDPLTASFSNVPESHTGSDSPVDLTFGEAPDDVGWRDIQNAVKVTGGSINRTTNCGGRPVTQALVSWKSLCPHSGFDDAGINAAIHARGQQAGGWRWSRLRQSCSLFGGSPRSRWAGFANGPVPLTGRP